MWWWAMVMGLLRMVVLEGVPEDEAIDPFDIHWREYH
jgi:hypothetical protein